MAVTASEVKALRETTGLPLMDCKKALEESGGDKDAAIQLLRERGAALQTSKFGARETAFGRFGLFTSFDPAKGAMVEFKCETAPVAQNEEFQQIAIDLAQQLALGPGAATADELLEQPSPSKEGVTLREQMDELFNRIREKFEVGRMVRFDGACAGYEHFGGTIHGVLVEVSGGDQETARDVAMHIAAMRPEALSVDQLDQTEVEKERGILREQALREGKPENIVEKMVEGRMKNYFAERVLLEQQFVKSDDKITVAKFAKDKGMEIKRYEHWVLGE